MFQCQIFYQGTTVRLLTVDGFVEAGASLNLRDNEGDTALAIAHKKKHQRVIEALTAAGNHENLIYLKIQGTYILQFAK